MESFVRRLNMQRFREALILEKDADKRRVLERLIAEEAFKERSTEFSDYLNKLRRSS